MAPPKGVVALTRAGAMRDGRTGAAVGAGPAPGQTREAATAAATAAVTTAGTTAIASAGARASATAATAGTTAAAAATAIAAIAATTSDDIIAGGRRKQCDLPAVQPEAALPAESFIFCSCVGLQLIRRREWRGRRGWFIVMLPSSAGSHHLTLS